uniref:ribosomal protein S3 n=1 Tax=Poriella subacida TaxID=2872513 RepID=UPI00300231F4|nr:ribosomal protein S3 [Poriella subacida]
MNYNQSILPINNHYSTIDLFTLKSNNYKIPTSLSKERRERIQIKSIEKSPLLEIVNYSDQLIKNSNIESKESLILNTKKLISQEIKKDQTKSSYYQKIDMLSYIPKQKKDTEMQTKIQKYLKSFTTLDIPLAQNQNTLYEFNPKTLNSNILNKNVYKILEYSFFEMSSVISKPYFYVTPNNVIINLFFFVMNKKGNQNLLEKNVNKLQGISNKLSKYFKKPIKLELTQLYSISHNSQILINILGKLGLFRRNSFTRIIGRFLKHQSSKIIFRSNNNKLSKFTSILTGVNIKLGGRLMRGKIVPRRTVKKIQYGSLSRSKSNYITTARLTQKNKRGSFSFTVSIGHKFF